MGRPPPHHTWTVLFTTALPTATRRLQRPPWGLRRPPPLPCRTTCPPGHLFSTLRVKRPLRATWGATRPPARPSVGSALFLPEFPATRAPPAAMGAVMLGITVRQAPAASRKPFPRKGWTTGPTQHRTPRHNKLWPSIPAVHTILLKVIPRTLVRRVLAVVLAPVIN